MPSSAPQPEQLHLSGDGRTPNSPHPVLIYRGLPLAGPNCADSFENLFASHLWPAQWRAGVYDYHHFHTTAHEVLGVARGSARLMLGGEEGVEVEVKAKDALVLPAGTGHRLLWASDDFLVVGGYPVGQHYDALRPGADDFDAAAERSAHVSVPVSDPVAGTQGALVALWRRGGATPQASRHG